ncbi:hypothetical protein ACIHCX_26670 [Streptomyces sp. NPDC052043]|uniref:hypothetical protein n=1 Tax=Streptomyces sp. NPDC052043 TaxID=3365684 RepID=UPI0037D316DD
MTAPGSSGVEAGPPGFGAAGVAWVAGVAGVAGGTERLDVVHASSCGGADAGLSVVGELP